MRYEGWMMRDDDHDVDDDDEEDENAGGRCRKVLDAYQPAAV